MQRLKDCDAGVIRHEMRSILAITQDFIVAALAETTFFHHAALHGETALRAFFGDNRCHRHLDFSLLKPAGEFLWEPYLFAITGMMAEYGCSLKAQERRRQGNGLAKRYANDNVLSCLLVFTWAQRYSGQKKGTLKLRMNAHPPDNGGIILQAKKLRDSGWIQTFDLPTLCAEKYQALLCREHERGLDWYDLLRLRAKNIEPNYRYLEAALNQDGPWKGQAVRVNKEWLAAALKSRIDNLDVDTIKQDICRFVDDKEYDEAAGWNKETRIFI
jgi:hypothetical protein